MLCLLKCLLGCTSFFRGHVQTNILHILSSTFDFFVLLPCTMYSLTSTSEKQNTAKGVIPEQKISANITCFFSRHLWNTFWTLCRQMLHLFCYSFFISSASLNVFVFLLQNSHFPRSRSHVTIRNTSVGHAQYVVVVLSSTIFFGRRKKQESGNCCSFQPFVHPSLIRYE